MSDFKAVALNVVKDIAEEIAADVIRTKQFRESDPQRLYNASVASLELGATREELNAAMEAGRAAAIEAAR